MARHISFIRTLNIRPLLAVVVPLRIPATMLSKVKRETLATPSIAVPFPHKEMDTDLIGSKKTIIRTLEQMLNINTFEALDLYFKNKDLSNVSSSSLKSIHNIYLDYSVNNETLIKYPELLTLDAKTLERKLIILKDLPYDINETVMLCLLSMDTLPVFVKLELKNKGRIENLRKILEVCFVKQKSALPNVFHYFSLMLKRLVSVLRGGLSCASEKSPKLKIVLNC